SAKLAASMTADATRAEYHPSGYSGEPTGALVTSVCDDARRAPITVASRHRAAAASTCQIACRGRRPSARHSEVGSDGEPIVTPAAAITSAEMRTRRKTGRLAARSRFPPIAPAAITACAMVDAVAPKATTGTSAADGISH